VAAAGWCPPFSRPKGAFSGIVPSRDIGAANACLGTGVRCSAPPSPQLLDGNSTFMIL